MTEQKVSLDGSIPAVEGDLRLPKQPGVIRLFWQRHPWLTDSLIAGVYAIPVLLGALVFSANTMRPIQDALLFLCAAGSVAAVLFRRRAPLIAFAISLTAAAIPFSVTDGVFVFGLCLLLYAVPVYSSNRNAWVALGCSAAVLLIASVLPWPEALHGRSGPADVIAYAVILLAAVLIGVNIGNRKRYLLALIDRAAQLARERDQQAQLASAAERSRIAREMHDIVSHSLTVMVTLADGSAALIESSPERSRDAMVRVAETGRHALTDMRRMLGVLGESGTPGADSVDPTEPTGDLAPQPAASDLSDLIDRFRAAGLPVRYTVSGVAPDDSGLQLTVYRVVQEALTNVLRHAPSAARVRVEIGYSNAVRVEIANSASPASTAPPIRGAGRGLVGLRERIALYGGTLETGTTTDGWRVLAEIPSAQEEQDR